VHRIGEQLVVRRASTAGPRRILCELRVQRTDLDCKVAVPGRPGYGEEVTDENRHLPHAMLLAYDREL
jgi:hypothetical protein